MQFFANNLVWRRLHWHTTQVQARGFRAGCQPSLRSRYFPLGGRLCAFLQAPLRAQYLRREVRIRGEDRGGDASLQVGVRAAQGGRAGCAGGVGGRAGRAASSGYPSGRHPLQPRANYSGEHCHVCEECSADILRAVKYMLDFLLACYTTTWALKVNAMWLLSLTSLLYFFPVWRMGGWMLEWMAEWLNCCMNT